eukprot:UC1_evm1s329
MSAAASASRRHGRGGSNNSSRPSAAAASSARDVTGAAVVGGTASFGDGEVEAEYIKNLQQQVYYLELEVNFLRGEVKKAASSSSREQEKAFAKAQRAKEQEWEAEATELESRLRQAEFDLETSRSEALAAGERYRTARDAHAQDKRDLVGQLAACKKQLEEATARCAQTEQHSLRMRGEVGQRAK